MKCPVCPSVDLVMSDRQGVEIDYCPQCRGVWLDRGELDKIIERSAPQQPYQGQAQQQQPPRRSHDYDRGQPQRPGHDHDRDHHDYDRKHHDHDRDHSYGDHRHKKKRENFLSELFDF